MSTHSPALSDLKINPAVPSRPQAVQLFLPSTLSEGTRAFIQILVLIWKKSQKLTLKHAASYPHKVQSVYQGVKFLIQAFALESSFARDVYTF